MKRSNQGFTLIELIIVIVILGILAVTASPKFLDLQGDARAATLEGVEAALKGAAQISYSKALIANQVGPTGTLDLDGDGDNEALVNGYPAAEAVSDIIETDDWQVVAGDTITRIYPTGLTIATVSGDTFTAPTGHNACYLTYTEAAANARPTYGRTVTGC